MSPHTTTATRPRTTSSRNPRQGRQNRRHEQVGAQKRAPGDTLGRIRRERFQHKVQKAYKRLKERVFELFTREEVNQLARETGFYERRPRAIEALEFVLCCALAAVVEGKRGFASVWRVLTAATGRAVVRSAVTQRFGEGSASLLRALFERAAKRLPQVAHPDLLARLEGFEQVLAQDGSVLKLSPILAKLFPATRTNSTKAAGKLHATADIVHWRIVDAEVTGERESELGVVRSQAIQPNTLYLRDLGYNDYDELDRIVQGHGQVLMRLKQNANPVLVKARCGVLRPRQSEGEKFQDLQFARSRRVFDLDARFRTSNGSIVLRVVGLFNPETDRYHCYVTSLPPEQFTVEELQTLYALRWTIELLFKLLKSSCHLDHLRTSDPNAVRTHIYASLLASIILSALAVAAAEAAGIPPREISMLMVGIAAPLLAVPLMLLWCERELTYDELAAMLFRTVAIACRDQNPGRTGEKWGVLGRCAHNVS
jgi:IS4 transposase